MKRLALHLGIHKTATTSLQSFFNAVQPQLSRHDVHFYSLERTRRELTPLIKSLRASDRERLALLLLKDPSKTVFISDENILGNADEVPRNELYLLSENRIRRTIEQFDSHEMHIFLTIRSQADFLTSLYCEYLRHNPFVHFSNFLNSIPLQNFSYERMFGWITALPPHVTTHVIPFETSHGGGLRVITERILRVLCGRWHRIDLKNLPTSKSRSSFSEEELELLAHISSSASPKAAQLFARSIESAGERFGSRPLDLFTSEQRAELEAIYQCDLAFFDREFKK